MKDKRWQKLQVLFHQAQKLPDNEIKVFLERSCEDDTKLRDEIFSLLKKANKSSSDLTDHVAKTAKDLLRDTQTKGSEIGPYRVIKELGSGGMGTVYLAERADGNFEQQVAIKLISGIQHSKTSAHRFIAERQILAQLKHPNIAHLLDGGTTQEGDPYFAMEHVRGKNIIEYSNHKQLNIRQRIQFFIKICDAVSYAHGQLVLHRDIKPSNILISEDGQPKLLDFGIAKLINTDDANVSITGDQLIMTPEYASPEQVLGQTLGVTTDIYQLGLVLYQLLTGELAQKIDHANIAQIKDVVVDSQPLSPSNQVASTNSSDGTTAQVIAADRSILPSKLYSKLKGDLDTIVLKCLNKDPKERYQTVNDFINDLDAYLELRPIKARGLTSSYRFNRFIRRHWAGVTAAFIAVVALFAGLTFSLISLDATKKAQLQTVKEAETSNQVSQFLIDMLTFADPRDTGGKKMTVDEVLQQSAKHIDDLNSQPEVQLKVLTVIGEAFTAIGEYDSSQKYLQRALNLTKQFSNKDKKILLEPLMQMSASFEAQGNYDEALKLAEQVVELARKNNYLTTGMLMRLHTSLFNKLQFEKANSVGLEALDLLNQEQETEEVRSRKANILSFLGYNADQMGNTQQAEFYLRSGLDLLDNNPNNLSIKHVLLAHLGLALAEKERYEEAEKLQLEAVNISKKVYGDNHDETMQTLSNLGWVQSKLLKYEAANKSFSQALDIGQTLEYGHTLPSYIALLNRYSNLNQRQGNYLVALKLVNESIEISEQVYGENDARTVNSKSFMLSNLIALGRFAQAQKIAQYVIIEMQKLFPSKPYHGLILFPREKLLRSKLGLGLLEESLSGAMQYISDAQSVDNERFIVAGLEILFHVNYLQGNIHNAEKTLQQLDKIISKEESQHVSTITAKSLQLQAQLQSMKGEDMHAITLIQSSIDTLKKEHASMHPSVLNLLMEKATFMSLSLHNKKAIKLAKQTYNLWLEKFAEKENTSAFMAISLAKVYQGANMNNEIIELLSNYLTNLNANLGKNHYKTILAQCYLANAYLNKTKSDEFVKIKQASLQQLTITLGVNSPVVKSCQN